jgi:predicted dehydrogenase
LKTAIIGCGLIGQKRAALLAPGDLLAVADLNLPLAQALAAKHPGCLATADAAQALAVPGVEAVIVATTHKQLAPLATQALKAGKHVLVEKPAARNADEFRPVVELAEKLDRRLKVGYNHRFHPALREAHRLLQTPEAGPMLYLRARYGHGGRLGYEKEWRAQKEISGGGELIDQGLHLVDLARWFLGDVKEASGYLPTLYWDMGVEDNAFLLLKHAGGRPAWLHASWTEWKNTFSLEAESRFMKVQVDGLGGSYGPETLTVYRQKPGLGPPDMEKQVFDGPDFSWAAEWAEFRQAVKDGREPLGSGRDGLAALEAAAQVYASSPAEGNQA